MRIALSTRSCLVVAAVAAMCVLLVLPISLAGARSDRYTGAVDLPELDPGVVPPASVEFKLKHQRNNKKKFVPTLIPKLKMHNVYFPCSDGDFYYPSDIASEIRSQITFPIHITVKKRKFSAHLTEEESGSFGFTFAGKVPRSGPAAGILRISTHIPADPDPEFPQPALDCDTSDVSWTADK